MLRLLFWIVILYLAYKIYKTVFRLPQKNEQNDRIKGQSPKKSMDFDRLDIEDAKFKDIK